MQVRSLNSSVFKWPDAKVVDDAAHRWAAEESRIREGVLRIGYFGSYARGDWGVGSDLDLVVAVTSSTLAFERRAVEWDTTKLPVPADLLVYTNAEWQSLAGRFRDTLEKETVWVFVLPSKGSAV